jgi:hypothetical protein
VSPSGCPRAARGPRGCDRKISRGSPLLAPGRPGVASPPGPGRARALSAFLRSDAVEEFEYLVVGAGTAGCVGGGPAVAGCQCPVAAGGGRPAADSCHEGAGGVAGQSWLGSGLGKCDDRAGGGGAGGLSARPGPGGSGEINAMVHVRGHRAVYDGWAASGAPGWGFRTCCRAFGAARELRDAIRRCALCQRPALPSRHERAKQNRAPRPRRRRSAPCCCSYRREAERLCKQPCKPGSGCRSRFHRYQQARLACCVAALTPPDPWLWPRLRQNDLRIPAHRQGRREKPQNQR